MIRHGFSRALGERLVATGWLRLAPRLALGLAALSGIGLVGCEPAKAPERLLPAYMGDNIQVFDDGIDPAAVGLTLEPSAAPISDAHLRERVQTSDATVRVRVQTVTEKHEERGTSYVLGLKREEVFGGAFPPAPGDAIQVHIGLQSSAHGVVQSFESRLVGRTFIACVRQFAHGGNGGTSGDDRDLHFHFYTDDARTTDAVKSAYALEGFR